MIFNQFVSECMLGLFETVGTQMKYGVFKLLINNEFTSLFFINFLCGLVDHLCDVTSHGLALVKNLLDRLVCELRVLFEHFDELRLHSERYRLGKAA